MKSSRCRPRPGEAGEYGRISLLDGIVLLKNRPDEIYLPDRFEAQLREIYEWMGLDRAFLPDTANEETLAGAGEVALSAKRVGDADVVKIEVESLGSGLAERLADAERDNPGMHVYQLVLPLWLPGGSAAVETAHRAGFFFGGLLPHWFDRDALLMQKVAGTPDFSKPLLHGEEGKAIKEMVEADWRTLQDGD